MLKAGWREVDPPRAGPKKAAERRGGRGRGAAAGARRRTRPRYSKAEALAKQTKAPPRYSESSLLGAMETAGKKIEDEELRLAMRDSGLGTPATRASIIETLLKREYVARDKKSLVATAKGAALIKMLPSPLLKSAELTGRWEQKLARMARGEYARELFMGEVQGDGRRAGRADRGRGG